MLTRLYVDGYKCLADFTLSFSEKTVLVGPNGVGKSAVLEVLGLLQQMLTSPTPVSPLFSQQSKPVWDPEVEQQRLALEVVLPAVASADTPWQTPWVYTYEATIGYPTDPQDQQGAYLISEGLVCNGIPLIQRTDTQAKLHPDPIRTAQAGLTDHTPTSPIAYPCQQALSVLGTIPTAPYHKPLPPVPLDYPCLSRFTDWIERMVLWPQMSYSEFAAWYDRCTQADPDPDRIAQLIDKIAEGLPEYKVWVAQKDPWGEMARASRGQQTLVVLYSLLFAASPTCLVCLDNPEMHLALYEVQPWLAELDECGRDLPQVLLTTHHPETINYLFEDTVWLNKKPEGSTYPITETVQQKVRETGLRPAEVYARRWYE